MEILQKIEKSWGYLERGILSLTTILMSVMLIGNALSRYIFSKSWGFTEEIGQLAIVVLTFMGLGYAARKSMHIEMSGFFDLLPMKYRRLLRLFINFVTAVILVFVTYLSFQYVFHLQDIGQVTPILRLPIYTVMFAVPIGFLFAFISYVIDFIKVVSSKELVEEEEVRIDV